jgi:hypothetical protein
MDVVKIRIEFAFWLALFAAPAAFGDEFSFQIGSPIAARTSHMKSASFVFRTQGCADLAKSDVGATAEGLVNGERRSVRLKVAPASTPGVYAIFREWPTEGVWVIHLTGRCAESAAGALVAIGPRGFVREQSKFFSRRATDSEIDNFLKSATSQ